MSPEQARGKTLDKRADIWAFGVVLYELLVGHGPFGDEDVAGTLAAVIHKEPDLTQVPAKVRRLLQRCLEKDSKKRLRDIGDVWELLEEAPAPSVAAKRPERRWLWPAAVGVFLLAFAALAFVHFREKPPAAPQALRFTIPLPENGNLGQYLSISPDGRRVAFIFSSQGTTRLWVRALDSLQSHPLAGTEGTDGVPFWSFDSRYIVFWTGGKLKKIEASGGPPQTLCDVPVRIMRGFWTQDNRIVFGSETGVFQVAAGGGVA